jgi:hypothetical protein
MIMESNDFELDFERYKGYIGKYLKMNNENDYIYIKDVYKSEVDGIQYIYVSYYEFALNISDDNYYNFDFYGEMTPFLWIDNFGKVHDYFFKNVVEISKEEFNEVFKSYVDKMSSLLKI